MLIALGLVFIGCLSMYWGNSFASVQILFACVGISFAVIKVSVYSMVGLITSTEKQHESILSSIESIFMIGIAAGFVAFPYFYSDTDPGCLVAYLFGIGRSCCYLLFCFIVLEL